MTPPTRPSLIRRILGWILLLLIFLFILSIIGGIIVLNNLTIAENWFGLNEYQVVETRHQIIRLFPYFWVAGILLVFLIGLIIGIKKRKKSPFYWLFSLLLLPVILFCIGVVSTFLPVDRQLFREEASAKEIMAALPNQSSFKDKELQLVSYSFHIRNVPLKSGIYAVARVINPNTDLQDEYWYYPENLLTKWKKDDDTIELSMEDTIAFDAIDWGVIPKIIKDSEARAAQLDHYVPGVSIVILNGFQGEWTWTVGLNGIRNRTEINYVYDLKGNYQSEWQ